MNKFSAVGGLIAAAFLMAACSDVSAVPSSPLGAQGPAFELGNPPPPPLSGGVSLSFDAGDSFDASIAADVVGDVPPGPCRASELLNFTYDFLVNPPGNNAFLHLRGGDDAHLVTIHQTDSKLDAHGTIVGDGFTFDISDATDGSIVDIGHHGERLVSVSLSGTLTTSDGASCQASANLSGHLGGGE
ncbi:MAG: hypothetical protein ACHQWU_11270 [Gemmatimonadales bacterium]